MGVDSLRPWCLKEGVTVSGDGRRLIGFIELRVVEMDTQGVFFVAYDAFVMNLKASLADRQTQTQTQT